MGGTAKVPMAELRALAESLGARDVSTYIASGNLLCTPPADHADFDRELEAAIEERFGFFREAISRTRSELSAALRRHPFEVVDPKTSAIMFLSSKPPAAAVEEAAYLSVGEDRWQVIGSDLHIRYAHSPGRAQMNVPAVVKALGVAGTARNLLTVQKLIELMA